MTHQDYFNWIRENTKGCSCVVDFGSMFFEKLRFVHEAVKRKIGIEVYKPYIDRATYHDCEKIHGDFRNFENLLGLEDVDCLLCTGAIEHINKEDGIDLIKRCQKYFNRLLVMTPEGYQRQDFDRTKLGGDVYQTHRSGWTKDDFKRLGFQNIIVDPTFHKQEGQVFGAIFARWDVKC